MKVEGQQVERRRHENRGSVGAENRGAVDAEEGRVWEGVSPSRMGDGSGEGAVPPPQKFF